MSEIGKFFHATVGSLSQADLIILSGILATVLQYFINRFKDFATIVNYFLALAVPFITVILTSLVGTGSPLAKYPTAFLVAQTVYQVTEWLKRNAVQKAVDVPATF